MSQVRPSGQLLKQAPQWLGSLRVSTQAPPQVVRLIEQGAGGASPGQAPPVAETSVQWLASEPPLKQHNAPGQHSASTSQRAPVTRQVGTGAGPTSTESGSVP